MTSRLMRRERERERLALARIVVVLANDALFLLIGMMLGMLMP